MEDKNATKSNKYSEAGIQQKKEASLSIRKLDEYIGDGILKAHNYGTKVMIDGKSLLRFVDLGPLPYKNKEVIHHDKSA